MKNVVSIGKRGARSGIPILIEGESGVGKEVIARAIQGKPVAEALNLTHFSDRKAAGLFEKALKSAVANAEHNEGYERSSLIVSEARADQGPSLRRYRPRAQGRAYMIRKPTCHITVAVAPNLDEG